jgi:hypothetical protein
LGYISVLDSLKTVTDEEKSPMTTSQTDEKYRVVAPEAMHETFMSDSEEEGGMFLLCFLTKTLSEKFHTNTLCMPEKKSLVFPSLLFSIKITI